MKTSIGRRDVTLFIDFEGKFGYQMTNDIHTLEHISAIQECLDRFHVPAVFNVCTALSLEIPDIIRELHRSGHEIAVHGHTHENFLLLRTEELSFTLRRSSENLTKLTGVRPLGIRAPFLLSPLFYSRRVYNLFKKTGFVWTSNRERFFRWELFRPDIEERIVGMLASKRLIIPRNVVRQLLRFRSLGGIALERWTKKFDRIMFVDGLEEFPIMSSLDCDLLGFPNPQKPSDRTWLNYAVRSLKSEFDQSGHYFNLNFHDWIIGSSNRIRILDQLLEYMTSGEVKFRTASDIWSSKNSR